MKSSEYRLSETNEFLFSPIYFEKMRLRRERDLWVPFFAVPFFFARRGERAGGDAEVNINCGRPYAVVSISDRGEQGVNFRGWVSWLARVMVPAAGDALAPTFLSANNPHLISLAGWAYQPKYLTMNLVTYSPSGAGAPLSANGK